MFIQNKCVFFVGMWESLTEQHRKRSHKSNVITDVCDADIMQQDSFFDCPEHAGVILCTDGVPVIKSSGMLYYCNSYTK